MIQKFLDYLSFEKRYSPHTINAYRRDLNQFKQFLLTAYEIDVPRKATHQMIRSWIVDLMERDLSSRSVNRKISSLKSFFKFLLRRGDISSNPMSKILSPKTSKKLPVFVEETKMGDLFKEDIFSNDFQGWRDRLTIELFYITGMRLSELINIKESDIVNYRYVKVLGKGNKERLIPLTKKFGVTVNKYLELKRQQIFDFNSEELITLDNGKKLYEKFVYRMVNRYLSLITSMDKKSPHVLRHTFATHMLNNGADLNSIKEILGHANLSATQIYTHNTIEKLKNIHKQSHPKG